MEKQKNLANVATIEEVVQLLATAYQGEDAEIIYVDEQAMKTGKDEVAKSCYGRVMGTKDFNIQGLQGALTRAWAKPNVRIYQANRNTIQAYFESLEDMMDVIARGPWNFENNLVLLAHRDEGQMPTDEEFYKCLFWIQVRDLPRNMCSREVGMLLYKYLYPATTVQLKEDPKSGQRWFRVRRLVDVRLPLRRVVRFHVDGGKDVRGFLRYERLPILCFACGTVGHARKECKAVQDPSLELSYGSWMSEPRGGGRLLWSFGDGGRGRSGEVESGHDARMEVGVLAPQPLRVGDPEMPTGERHVEPEWALVPSSSIFRTMEKALGLPKPKNMLNEGSQTSGSKENLNAEESSNEIELSAPNQVSIPAKAQTKKDFLKRFKLKEKRGPRLGSSNKLISGQGDGQETVFGRPGGPRLGAALVNTGRTPSSKKATTIGGIKRPRADASHDDADNESEVQSKVKKGKASIDEYESDDSYNSSKAAEDDKAPFPTLNIFV